MLFLSQSAHRLRKVTFKSNIFNIHRATPPKKRNKRTMVLILVDILHLSSLAPFKATASSIKLGKKERRMRDRFWRGIAFGVIFLGQVPKIPTGVTKIPYKSTIKTGKSSKKSPEKIDPKTYDNDGLVSCFFRIREGVL